VGGLCDVGNNETELDRGGVLWEVCVMSVTSIFKINSKDYKFHELLVTTECRRKTWLQ
jgi:hypothetical protein